MKITLLTHERELDRPDNSGVLVERFAGCEVQRVIWQRTNPDLTLVSAFNSGEAVLLTPSGDGPQIADINSVKHWVILDATWQEAKKMYNKSPYLLQANWSCLAQPFLSSYRLRRNQIPGGLCTAECAIALLQSKGMDHQPLSEAFARFNSAVR